MKKTKSILALAMACILFLGALFGTGVTATAKETTNCEFDFNVVYEGYMHLAVGVNIITSTDAEFTLYVFDEGTEIDEGTENGSLDFAQSLYSTSTIRSSTDSQGKTTYFFVGHGVAAKNISTQYLYVLVDAEEKVVHSQAYSIADYCNTRISYYGDEDESTPEVSDAQHALYQAILTYGEAAREVLVTK